MQGYYINLASSTARDEAMQSHLEALNLQAHYQRFEAVVGKDLPELQETALTAGHLGCWFSHQALWQQISLLEPGQLVHILEDDARLHPLCYPLLQELSSRANWDILFTDVYLHPPPSFEKWAIMMGKLKQYQETQTLQLLSLKGWRFTGTTSYVLSPKGAKILLQELDGRWREGASFDVLLDHLVQQGKLDARVIMPFISTISMDADESTTGAGGGLFDMLNAFRRIFYIGADMQQLRERVLGDKSDLSLHPFLDVYLAMLKETLKTMIVE